MATPWVVWAIVRTFGLDRGGRIVPAMAFTPYVAFSAWVPLALAVVLRRRTAAVVALTALVALAAAVVPRLLPGPRPAIHDGVPLRVMTANLYGGRGDPRTVVGLVRRRRIDVLSLQELTPEEVRRLDAAGLRRLLPYRDVDARSGASGSGLFSRLPLRRLPQVNALGVVGEPRAAVRVPGAPPVEVEAVHPPPPLSGTAARRWRTMLGEIPRPDLSRPTLRLVLGDFNATLDHRQLRLVLDGGFVDGADATGEGERTTWPAGRRFPPEITIDHVLVDRRVAVRSLSVHTVPFSDHRAVTAVLELPRAGR